MWLGRAEITEGITGGSDKRSASYGTTQVAHPVNPDQ
jgi:hypothetical protein